MFNTENTREQATCCWAKGKRHSQYEDRFCLLTNDIPAVKKAQKGEIVAVFDGVGSAPKGMAAAQTVCDHLRYFYTSHLHTKQLTDMLVMANDVIHNWGFIDNSDRTQGACAGTVVWIKNDMATFTQVGDTTGLIWRNGNVMFQTFEQQSLDGSLINYYGVKDLQPTTDTLPIEEDDWIVLASDGITKVLSNAQIQNLLADAYDAEDATKRITQAALSKGASDDVTLLIYEYYVD